MWFFSAGCVLVPLADRVWFMALGGSESWEYRGEKDYEDNQIFHNGRWFDSKKQREEKKCLRQVCEETQETVRP